MPLRMGIQTTPVPVAVPEPAPETRRVFAMRVVRWLDAQGVQRLGDQYTSVDLTPAAASRGLRRAAVVPLDDPRCGGLRGLHGGRHPNPKNALDLDDEEACRPAHDLRISVHESGHAVAARLLGHPLGGATVDPGPGFEGRVRGERHMEAFAEGRGDASDAREAIAPLMREAGEDRRPVTDVFGNVYAQSMS
jgi:hypothetical protein